MLEFNIDYIEIKCRACKNINKYNFDEIAQYLKTTRKKENKITEQYYYTIKCKSCGAKNTRFGRVKDKVDIYIPGDINDVEPLDMVVLSAKLNNKTLVETLQELAQFIIQNPNNVESESDYYKFKEYIKQFYIGVRNKVREESSWVKEK